MEVFHCVFVVLSSIKLDQSGHKHVSALVTVYGAKKQGLVITKCIFKVDGKPMTGFPLNCCLCECTVKISRNLSLV